MDDAAVIRDRPIATVFIEAAPILRRIFRQSGLGGEAEDLVQECFRRTLDCRARHPLAYLRRTATNLAVEQHRFKVRRSADRHVPADDHELGGPDPMRHLEAADMLRRIDAQLARLSGRTRAVFIERRIDGRSLTEISVRHGLSVKATERHVTKALRAIFRTRRRWTNE